MKRNSRTKQTTTNDTSQDLKIKDRKLGTFKSPPPRRLNRMLRAINNRCVHQDLNNTKHHPPPTNEPDLCKDYISMEEGENDRFSISFPKNCVFGHVLSDTNPLDDMVPRKEVVRPSKKPRSVGPRR